MAKKKWYSYFVVTGEEGATGSHASSTEPRRVEDVAAEVTVDPQFASTATAVTDLSEVYESAKIAPPAHGYTILKVADMLESEHIRSLPADVKRKSVLVALDAAGVKVDDIVQDAVRRDHALDVWQWVLRLSPSAGLAVQLAALFHDVGRLLSEVDRAAQPSAGEAPALELGYAEQGANAFPH